MPYTIDDLVRVLRQSHDQLAAAAETLPTDRLTEGSYARDWTIAQVFSHLGSGAEIGLASIRAAGGAGPETDREAIWDRWNALPPEEMARQFVEHDERYLDYVERLPAADRDALRVQFFLGPTRLDTLLLFRLNEHALHAWDVRVSLDPSATLLPAAVPPLLELPPMLIPMLAGGPAADRLAPARLAMHTTAPDRDYLLVVAGEVALREAGGPADGPPSGRLELPAEAFLRLIAGRLDPGHVPGGTVEQGTPTLADLRILFPGF